MNIRRDVWFSAALCFYSAVALAAAVQVKRSQYKIDINIDGKPFTSYYFDPEMAKPYLMPLRTASGDIISRPFPVRNDVSMANPRVRSFEPHQRPLYFGHGDIDGLDFWEEPVFDKYFHLNYAHRQHSGRWPRSVDAARG